MTSQQSDLTDPELYAESSKLNLVNVLFHNKWTIITATLVSAVIALVVAMLLPNKYVSEATLIPSQASNQGRLASLASQFGGLASLAGIDISAGSSDKSQLIIETLNSRQFLVEFVKSNNLVVPLFAGVAQSDNENEWVLDPSIYIQSDNKWVRQVSLPFEPEPSDWEIYKKFKEEVLVVNQDKKSGMIRVAVRLRSPYAAKTWLDNLIVSLNSWMRLKTIVDKQLTIKYLLTQIEKTEVNEMHKLFYSLIEKEQTELMLAETQMEYALKLIDPGIVPPLPYEPRRFLIVFMATILGFLIGIIAVMTKTKNFFSIR